MTPDKLQEVMDALVAAYGKADVLYALAEATVFGAPELAGKLVVLGQKYDLVRP